MFLSADTDDCTAGSCENGGTCIDGVNMFTCECTGTGFEGTTCSTSKFFSLMNGFTALIRVLFHVDKITRGCLQ